MRNILFKKGRGGNIFFKNVNVIKDKEILWKRPKLKEVKDGTRGCHTK